jgi:hypothetical protein
MSRLSLAATGWVAYSGSQPDPPPGNRLRWSWPEDAADDGQRILPRRIHLERAPVDLDVDVDAGLYLGPAASVPLNLWQHHGDLNAYGLTPVEVDLAQLAGGPVQAVRFTYEAVFGGTGALVQAFDGDASVASRWVQDGELVVIGVPSMDRLTVMIPGCTLSQVSTLDLYAPSQLPFEVIAEINVQATGSAAFGEVEPRYPASPTLDPSRWDELKEVWNAAWAEAPGAEGEDGGPNAWHALAITLAARWEHAVLCGLGFVDGPDHADPQVDDWHDLLDSPTAVAYRVRDADERLAESNVVFVPAFDAPDLMTVPAPTIGAAAVRLGSSGKIRAYWDVAWASPAPGIVGVEVEESLAIGGAWSTETYDGRGRRDTDPPGAGFVHREEEVTSHDLAVTARVRSQDGFDRVGPWGPSTPPTVLPIDHYPQPPPFVSATHDGTQAILTQSPPAGWMPDALVAKAGGQLRINRRIGDPVRLSVPVVSVIPNGGQLVVTLGGTTAPPGLATLVGGQLRIGSLKGIVTAVAWPLLTVDVAQGDGPIVAVSPGSTAELTQSPTYPDLFVAVDHRPATDLPSVIAFSDPLPAATTAEVVEYRAQLVFASQLGPLGAPVQAFRLPATPQVPPPFTVTILGVDFYQRTVVQLELTDPSSEPLEVWWADGAVSASDFSRRAVPGDAGLRYAEGGRILFDTLSLPVPNQVDRVVTIGVQAANAADGRSNFAILVHTLPK